MASETSELTFVRCPSCRSLVPTSAVRCRICNGLLEGDAKSAGSEANRPGGGRVRQKTITASAEELLQGTGVSGDPAASAPAAPSVPPSDVVATSAAAPPVSDQSDHEVVDPLADFLQEFDEPVAPVAAPPVAAAPIQDAPAAANDDDDLDTFLDDFEDYSATTEPANEPPVEPVTRPPVQAPPKQVAPPPPTPPAATQQEFDPFEIDEAPVAPITASVDDDFDLDLDPDPRSLQAAAPAARAPEPKPAPVPPPAPAQQPPRQAVEKRPPHAAPQQAAPARQERQVNQKQARPAPDQRVAADNRERGSREHSKAPAQERRENRDGERQHSHQNKHERRADENRKGHTQHETHRGEQHHEKETYRPQAHVSGPKTGKMRPGRLFGWFVSFESADGRAIELREGKFFVTASSIRGTDLVIEDPSISTPHALMSVSVERGLMIQDLMSERGVFVRSGDRGQYRREDGVTELKHGDWVRFGEVEFLVTVVPGAKRDA